MILKNKKVIVTGANRSIGREIALYCAKNGADVLISYRTDKIGAEATVQSIKEIGSNGLALYADFSQMAGVRAFTEEALSSLGTIDILINNAGMLSRETLFDLAPDKMQEVFQVNTLSPLYLTQLCIKNMIENQIKGCILNISSIVGSHTMNIGIAYASSKAAMNKWTKNAAMNLAKHGIRVNAMKQLIPIYGITLKIIFL
jgi:NAD(P)-dependent dehydrogenase (short-subunit alcohol dehydrogenase family)